MEPAAVETGRKTLRSLQVLLACALGLTVVFGVTTSTVLARGHATVSTARERQIPALLGALTAHNALSDADRAAWASFRSGEAQLIGPGPGFQNDITTAGQNLERLAVLDTTGARGRQLLQALNGQLVTYQGLVEQADATYRQGTRQLGYTYLTYGSTLLHGPGGLLSQIDQIAVLNQDALDQARASPWVDPGITLAVAATATALLACLVWAQAHTSRKFRRTLNPALLLACMLLIGLTSWGIEAIAHRDHALQAAERQALPASAQVLRRQITGADTQARGLREGHAVRRSVDPPPTTASAGSQHRLDSLLARAAGGQRLALAVPLISVLIALLTGVGLGARLVELRG